MHVKDVVLFDDGSREQLWLAIDGTLGIDATNPAWIESGRACPKEYGLYPLSKANLESCVLVEKFENAGKMSRS